MMVALETNSNGDPPHQMYHTVEQIDSEFKELQLTVRGVHAPNAVFGAANVRGGRTATR